MSLQTIQNNMNTIGNYHQKLNLIWHHQKIANEGLQWNLVATHNYNRTSIAPLSQCIISWSGRLLPKKCDRNRNLKISKALLRSQAHGGTSLFTSAV